MSRRTVDAPVFNLSFGSVRNDPICFSWISARLSQRRSQTVQFNAQLTNSLKLFEAEKQLAAFHSLANKQSLGHNFRAAAQTVTLHVSYDDFPSNLTYEFVEDGNTFLSEVVAPILSFFQRRRVLIGTARFTSSEKWIYAMPPFLAGEWIDSVAFGPETLEHADIASALVDALQKYDSLPDDGKGRVRMLLLRYNEVLNLPYIHERIDGLWRIIEALGKNISLTPTIENEYKRLLPICGAHKSQNLEIIIRALIHYGIEYSDDEVRDSRKFRNHVTHEYLDPALPFWETLPKTFRFLHRCVDKAVATELGLSNFSINEAAFTIIQNRVL